MRPRVFRMRWVMLTAILGTLTLAGLLGAATIAAQEPPVQPGDVTLDIRHRSIILDGGDERADIEAVLINTTQNPIQVRFEVIGLPEGWQADVWERFFDYKIISIGLLAEEEQNPRMRIRPPTFNDDETVHDMIVRIVAKDGTVLDSVDFTMQALSALPEDPGNASITSTFPVLRGPSSSRFEFEVSIRNDTGADASFNLSAAAPTNWGIAFSPAFEEDKLISSVSVNDGGIQRVRVQVDPPLSAEATDYPIDVTASNPDFSAQVDLVVTIIGRGDLNVATGSGQLNVDANAGDSTPVVFRVGNTGTADLTGVTLSAQAPQGWEVRFDPETVEALPALEIVDVQVEVVPAGDALPGDYLVTLQARNPQDLASLDLRVTVSQSTIWGWVGVAIVLIVLASLGVLFTRLGRR